MTKLQLMAIAGLMIGVRFVLNGAPAAETSQTSAEKQVTVVRHGAVVVGATAPVDSDLDEVSVLKPDGVEVVRREQVIRTAIKKSPTSSSREAEAMKAKLRLLAELADMGLMEIRSVPPRVGPVRKWRPKVYHGYHAKPNDSYHRRPDWQYNDATGWRYREEPAWSDRPGAVYAVLRQLPMRGPGWVVGDWE